jgi:RsmE family RNA methyltransferase
MNLLLLLPADATGDGTHLVAGDRAAHLRGKLAVEPGRRVHVGILDGPRGEAEVVSVGPEGVRLRTRALEPAPPRGRGRLLLALPRTKVLRRLLPQLAALGLDEIVLFRSWRVDRNDLESDLLDPARHAPLLHEGLMQACLTHAPRIRVERRFRPFVEDRLPAERPGEWRAVAHPRAERALGALEPPTGAWALAVGPERGFLDEEVAALARAGFTPAALGPGVLRVETACVAGIAQVLALAARAPAS